MSNVDTTLNQPATKADLYEIIGGLRQEMKTDIDGAVGGLRQEMKTAFVKFGRILRTP